MKRLAFTMAEILLSLTIIGVVAAITLPSLTGNINERTWNTQRKALYARMSQAIALMPALNGYGTLIPESSEGAGDAIDTATETFVTAGLSKVLKINNICDSDSLKDCGISSQINTMNGSVISFPNTMFELSGLFKNALFSVGSYSSGYTQIDTKAVAFETANGESIVAYYNPKCIKKENPVNSYFSQLEMCVNFIYDLNGNKGPNTTGKDIGFMTAFFPSDTMLVAPMPLQKVAGKATKAGATAFCRNSFDTEARLPSRHELAAMAFNNNLIGIKGEAETSYNFVWTSSKFTRNDLTANWAYSYISGLFRVDTAEYENTKLYIFCIKK